MKAPSEDTPIEPIAWQKGHEGEYWPTSLTRSFPCTATDSVESWPGLGWSRLVRPIDYSRSVYFLVMECLVSKSLGCDKDTHFTSLLSLVVCMASASSATQ